MSDIEKQINTFHAIKSEETTYMSRNFLLEILGQERGELSDEELVMEVLDSVDNRCNSSYEDALECIFRVYHFAKEINFIQGLVYAGIKLGTLYWYKGDFKLSIECFRLASQYNQTLNNVDYNAFINKGIGSGYLRMGFFKEALKHYLKALDSYKKIKKEYEYCVIYNNIGAIYKEMGDYGKALSYYLKSLNNRKINEDDKLSANLYLNIGILYYEQEDHKNALKYFGKVLEMPEKKILQKVIADTYGCMGQVYLKLENEKEALEFINRGLEISQKIGDKAGVALSYEELGAIMEARGEYEAAIINYEEALKNNREIGVHAHQANCLFHLAKVNCQMKNYEIAEEQLKESNRIRKELNTKFHLTKNYELLAQLCYDTGRFRESCDYKDKLYELQKEIYSEEKTKILAEMQTRFELQQRDLTIEKLQFKQETLLEANQELELFAGRAAHDLKEPLRVMSSFSSLLVRKYGEQLDSKGKKCIHYIYEGTQRMDKLLTDMLIYAKSGANPTKSTEVNLNDVMLTVESNLKLAITEKQANLQYEKLPNVKAINVGVVQLFQNIIANALKFSKPDTPPVIQINTVTHDENFYKISIKDNGIGIPESQQQKVFLIFERVHTGSKYKGTGIGLATCKKIVESLGGKIWLESIEGEGTTFFFLLPKV